MNPIDIVKSLATDTLDIIDDIPPELYEKAGKDPRFQDICNGAMLVVAGGADIVSFTVWALAMGYVLGYQAKEREGTSLSAFEGDDNATDKA
jgi:hypothetical protein